MSQNYNCSKDFETKNKIDFYNKMTT